MARILVMGSGSFGTSLAVMAQKYGHEVTLWSHRPEKAAQLAKDRSLPTILPGITLAPEILVTASLESLSQQDLVIMATPSAAVRSTAKLLSQQGLPAQVPVVCVSKGLEADTYKTMSDILEEEIRDNPGVILSGPSHAEELSRGMPTTIVSASRNRRAAELVQDLLMNETLRIYISDDVLGVEYGGALKNIIALAAGVLDGMGCGDNTKAALMTRGMAEISRLGVALGAKSETFFGLSGMGDLIVTCSSMHSRNRRCGMLIGKGMAPLEAIAEIGMVVEGYPCTKAAYELSRQNKVTMPIVEVAYGVLYEGNPLQEAIQQLMVRPKRHESETIWLLTR